MAEPEKKDRFADLTWEHNLTGEAPENSIDELVWESDYQKQQQLPVGTIEELKTPGDPGSPMFTENETVDDALMGFGNALGIQEGLAKGAEMIGAIDEDERDRLLEFIKKDQAIRSDRSMWAHGAGRVGGDMLATAAIQRMTGLNPHGASAVSGAVQGATSGDSIGDIGTQAAAGFLGSVGGQYAGDLLQRAGNKVLSNLPLAKWGAQVNKALARYADDFSNWSGRAVKPAKLSEIAPDQTLDDVLDALPTELRDLAEGGDWKSLANLAKAGRLGSDDMEKLATARAMMKAGEPDAAALLEEPVAWGLQQGAKYGGKALRAAGGAVSAVPEAVRQQVGGELGRSSAPAMQYAGEKFVAPYMDALGIQGSDWEYEQPMYDFGEEDLKPAPNREPPDEDTAMALSMALQSEALSAQPGLKQDVKRMLDDWYQGIDPTAQEMAQLRHRLSTVRGLDWASLDPTRRAQDEENEGELPQQGELPGAYQ